MTAIHTTTNDLGKFLTGLISRPVQAAPRRESAVATLAMKLAWDKYRRHVTPGSPFNRRLFAAHLDSAWYLARRYPKEPVEITLEECLHIAGKR